MGEDWKIIDEFPDYEVSTFGRVRNIGSGRVNNPSVRTHPKYNYNFLAIGLYKSLVCGKKKLYGQLIHRLVANQFIPNPDNKPWVDHIDGNAMNNVVSNLRWSTQKDNRWNVDLSKAKGYTTNQHSKNGPIRYCARIIVGEKQIALGTYDTPEEAHSAFVDKATELRQSSGFMRINQ